MRLALLLAFPLFTSIGMAQSSAPCRPLPPTPALRERLLDSFQRRHFRRSPDDSIVPEALDIRATVAFRSSHGCLTAIALADADASSPFQGALFLVDSAAQVAAIFPDYASPSAITPASPDHLVFSYVTGRGAGVFDSRLAVLCSFGTPIWTVCLDLEYTSWLDGPTGLFFNRQATFNVRSRFLLVRFEGTWNRNVNGTTVASGQLQPDTVRYRLP